MGVSQAKQCISYEDMQTILTSAQRCVIINTMPADMQHCLIANTLTAFEEEDKINGLIQSSQFNVPIVVYGKNHTDDSVWKKSKLLHSLGFKTVYVYLGGMFEWLLLQDIYGTSFFQTIGQELDILKFKAPSKIT